MLRFALVGGANTVLDFGILFILKAIGVNVLVANIISTTISFVFSFFANKKYTFKITGTNIKREMLLFVIVTLTGLWGLQTLVIWLTTPIAMSFTSDTSVALLASKLIATVASTIWNYVFYSRLVFIKH